MDYHNQPMFNGQHEVTKSNEHIAKERKKSSAVLKLFDHS